MSIEAESLTLGSESASSSSIVFEKATVANTLNLIKGSGDTVFTLASNVIFNGTGGALVDNDVLVSGEGVGITVQSGTWTTEGKSLTVSSGSTFTVDGDSDITFGAVDFASGSTLTITEGSVVLNGDAESTAENTVAGVSLSGATISLSGSSSLTLGEDLVSSIQVSGDTVTVADALKAKVSASSSSEILLDGSVSGASADGLTSSQVSSIIAGLTGASGTSSFTGIVNLGSNAIDLDITTDESGNKTISWDDFADFAGTNGESATFDELKETTVTGIDSGDSFKGLVGSLQGSGTFTNNQITASGKTGLYDADADSTGTKYYAYTVNDDGTYEALGINSTSGDLILANGGTIGKLSIASGSVILQSGYTDILGDVSASGDFVAETGSNVTVSGNVTTSGSLTASSGTTVEVQGKLTSSGSVVAKAGSTLSVSSGVATSGDFAAESGTSVSVSGDTVISGSDSQLLAYSGSNLSFAGNVSLSGGAVIVGDVEVTGENSNLSVAQNESIEVVGGSLSATKITLASGSTLVIGHDAVSSDSSSSSADSSSESSLYDASKSYTGSVFASTLDLAGGVIVLDPEYGSKASSLVVTNISTDNTLNGGLIIGQNSYAALGFDSTDEGTEVISDFLDDNGSLDKNTYGAALVLNKSLNIALNSGGNSTNDTIVLYTGTAADFITYYNANKSSSATAIDTTGTTDNERGTNIATALKDAVYLGANTAIVASAAATEAALVTSSSTGTALINFSGSSATAANIIADGGDVVLTGSVAVGQQYKVFGGTSSTDYNITYIDGTNYDTTNTDKADQAIELRTANGLLAGVVSSSGSATLALSDNSRSILSGASEPSYNTIVEYLERSDTTVSNSALDSIANSSNGADADRIVRAGAFTGVAQATVAAGQSTANAIASRFLLGSNNVGFKSSHNANGALFVAPIYANSDTDGFSAQGLGYGVDVDLYGAALGADFELAPNLRVGALFNVGKGDTEGNGAALGSSDDFSYFGLGIFAGYSAGALSIVGDINYTKVDNDLEVKFDTLDTLKTSLDSSNLNLGVSAQYALNVDGIDVLPHAGIRYTHVEHDDYAIESVGSYAGDSVNVVSIPVGVTVTKAFTSDSFTLKPLFDVTLTSNLGDDELEGSFNWANVDLKTSVATEILDNFSYGATAGVVAQSGNFAGAFGVNYTGSANVDSFAVSASARYLF